MGTLCGQPWWRALPDAPPDLVLGGSGVMEKQIGDTGPHRALAPSGCHSGEGSSPQHPLALVGAPLEQGCIGTSSQHQGRGVAAFGGLHNIPGAGGTCPSTSRAWGHPWEDRSNWFSSKSTISEGGALGPA